MDLNINDEILINYRHLECVLTPIEKNKTHWISIKNFIYHLIENQAYKKKSNTELQRIGEKRIKKQLLAYFTEVNNKNIMSKNLYEDYIKPIGNFMIKYYNFSHTGGKIKFLTIITWSTLGISCDAFVYSLSKGENFYFFTSLFVLLCMIRIIIKHKQKRVFGFNY